MLEFSICCVFLYVVCPILFKKFKNFCVNHATSVYSIDTNTNLIIHQKNVYYKVEQGERKG
jgi:hypothetical protein